MVTSPRNMSGSKNKKRTGVLVLSAKQKHRKNSCAQSVFHSLISIKGNRAAEATKTFTDLLASCNLQPRQNANDDLADQNTFGTLIKQFEQERPLPQAEPEWEDVDGIKKYIDTFFFGHLCHVVDIKNDNEETYRKAIEQYTVKPPAYDGDDDAVDISLLEKFSAKGDKKE